MPNPTSSSQRKRPTPPPANLAEAVKNLFGSQPDMGQLSRAGSARKPAPRSPAPRNRPIVNPLPATVAPLPPEYG
jgi:hypothetical protein